MDIFLSLIIFITGTFFGSFFTLAVYRIPRKEDILIKHSYCPNCNHKLGFFDLFPILSYVFLKGKCRYCNNKIRPRYLILEVFTGFTFLLIAISINIQVYNINNVINLIALIIYVSILFIIAGIDKEKIYIQKNVIAVGYVAEILYIIYQCTLQNINVYQYVMYLILLIIILLLSIIILKITKKDKYYIGILHLMLFMTIFNGSQIFILTSVVTLLLISITTLLFKKYKKIPIGFYLVISNIFVVIVSNILINYVI